MFGSFTPRIFLILGILLLSLCPTASELNALKADENRQPPNILIILADDLGFSDLGCYGGEIKTPYLDQLAQQGLRYNQFYNTGRCWPTRASIMTGYYPHQVNRDRLPGIRQGGNRGKRPAWAPLLPPRLPDYRAYHSGKWHIDGGPVANGFHRSFWMRDHGRFFHPRTTKLDDVDQPPVSPGTDYYVTTAIADHAVECLKDHAQNRAGQPFLSFVTFTAPHFPLHALPQDIAKYEGLYNEGWEVAREQRWKRQKELGLIEGELSATERDLGPPYDFPDQIKILGPGEVNRPQPWSELTETEQAFQAKKMEIHAAMVDRMDQEIGKILKQVKGMGAWDNTLVLFLSDNGASAEIMVRSDGHDPQATPGSAATHLCLGPGWSTVCNTPFRKHKTWVHEGGIATPLIAHWPAGIQGKNQIRSSPGHVIDIVPTILDLAGKTPELKTDLSTPALPGKSLVPTFDQDRQIARDDFFWYHEGHSGLRSGDFKLVRSEGSPWELYDLSADRTETDNLAADQPERLKEMNERWNARVEQFSRERGQQAP
ncbi:MAG: arylsulfatase [Mariniblastus sp.]|nr:arylsulfatase [Mariniblastus sp.]